MAVRRNASVFGNEGFGAFRITNIDEARSENLGDGLDVVEVRAGPEVRQVRITFTSAEVGNGSPNDSNTMANQDGGLAVRLQAEDAGGTPSGPVSRFDDEGINFIAGGDFTFDVRDLVTGAARGDQFKVVRLGTNGNDYYEEPLNAGNTYINAGQGNDDVRGGGGNDFLVGGAGGDKLSGGDGNDSFIGGTGDDSIAGGRGNDTAIFNITTDGRDSIDLGLGADVMTVNASAPTNVRLTFTSAEVGNNNVRDGNALANQDGGLAVRMQAENGDGALTGPITRVDDELITFVGGAGVTFDVRDLVSGVQRGDAFSVVQLGGSQAETFDQSARSVSYYINAGMGNDTLIGSLVGDFLVGGGGNDRINGNRGDDSFIGGGGADRFEFDGRPGNDRILDFLSGTDKIDLRSYDIDFDDLAIFNRGTDTVVGVDSNGNGRSDFFITLVNTAAPQESDFVL